MGESAEELAAHAAARKEVGPSTKSVEWELQAHNADVQVDLAAVAALQVPEEL